MKKFDLRQVVEMSRLEIFTALGLVVAAGLLLFRLGSAPKAASRSELLAYRGNSQMHQILNNPLDAPFKLLDFEVIHIHQQSLVFARLASVFAALLAVTLFFAIVLRWHGRRNAWMSTALFLSSGWLLHAGRFGTDLIVWLVVPLALTLLGSWLGSTERSGLAVWVSALTLGFTLFVPAGIWFVIAFIVLQRKAIAEHLAEAERSQLAGASILLIVFTGILAFAILRTPELLKTWAGMPQQLPNAMLALKHWAGSLTYPFVRGPGVPELWLAHTPILDVFESALVVLGSYFYIKHFRNTRTQTLLVFFLIGSVLVALNGAPAISFIVPLAYLVAATGIAYMLHKWFGVFPRNTLARGFGLTLICLAILASVTYHILAYYIAWQHSPDTVAVFTKILL